MSGQILKGRLSMPKLTSLAVSRQDNPGKYRDQNGLILQVSKSKSGNIRKSWLVRYSCFGKQREMGIGAFPDISLSKARLKATEIHLSSRQGIDPIRERVTERLELEIQTARHVSFSDCAERYLASHEPSWSNPKHKQQWRNTLLTYAYPMIGKMNVADITVGDVMRVIEPLWYTKTETASRIRGRIEKILAWAIVRGYRQVPNPAVWRGHLEMLLPKASKIRPVQHFTALDWQSMPKFMSELNARSAMSARALEFTILTAARSSEVRLSTWGEIDSEQALWVVPAQRMKMRKTHRVPLSPAALSIIERCRKNRHCGPEDYIFYARSPNTHLSNAVYRSLYKRMNREGLTTHGFRSTFRDWVGETTSFPREVAELSLAHNVGNATERAYRRGDALLKRRTLMESWANYCCST